MADFEIHIDPDRFWLEPALALTRGAFAPLAGLATFF